MSSWLARNKRTFEIDGAVLVGIIVLVVGIAALVLSQTSGSRSESVAQQRAVMPGHGLTMPSDVRVANRPGTLTVAMGDYWFKPSTHRVRAGRYRFTARNYGSIPHDIMLARMPIKFESPAQPADAGVGLDDMSPGMTRTMIVTLTPGRWEWFCSLPGHYAAGQRAVLQVVGHAPKAMRAAPSPSMGTGM